MTTVIVSAVVAAVLGGIGTYIAARRDLQLRFDASLRDLRIEAYKKLWKELEKLAKYGRPEALSKTEAQQLRDRLRHWYFHEGGLVLSTQTRQDYFALLDGLELVLERENPLGDEDDEFLRVLGSRLRTAMTGDVGTRRTFVFRGDAERNRLRLGTGAYVRQGGTERLVVPSERRFKLARLLRPLAKIRGGEPELELSDATCLSWDVTRQKFVLRVAAGKPDSEERVFLLEEGYVVEGPKGWRRGDGGRRRPSAIWKRSDPPPPAT